MQPFAPRTAGTVNIAVSAASQRDATVTADATTGTPIPLGAIEVMTVMAATHVAAIGTGDTGTIYFTPGFGL